MEVHPYADKNGFFGQLNLSQIQIQEFGFQTGGLWWENTETIISGTFPPIGEYFKRKGYVHYSSPRNKFWRHIDSIFSAKLFLPKKSSMNDFLRVNNALEKISFLKLKRIGLVDIYSKINRRISGSSKDIDIIPVETIFDNGVFELILNEGNVKQFIFVYSLSRDTFESEIFSRFGIRPKVVRKYNQNGIPLEVKEIYIKGEKLYLTYSPIHGRIMDSLKQNALKKALEFDFI